MLSMLTKTGGKRRGNIQFESVTEPFLFINTISCASLSASRGFLWYSNSLLMILRPDENASDSATTKVKDSECSC